jgi:predicted NBD/HSP70 family sugar kinase
LADVQADAVNGLSAARPQLIRAMNEQFLLEHIRLSGPCSRADLARVSSLSKPTVSLALANLERAGLVRLAGQRTGLPGRSALLYEVRPEAGFVLGLDIGMRFLRGAVADLAGSVRARASHDVSAVTATSSVSAASAGGPGFGAVSARERVAELVRLADELCAAAGITRSAVTQTVVGSPGIYDRERDIITLTGGLPGWNQPEALAELRAAFGPALTLENDVDAAALAERAHGHGRDIDDFAFVHVGTGIGMGLVLGGRLHRGMHGVAGEIAFMPFGTSPPASVAPTPSAPTPSAQSPAPSSSPPPLLTDEITRRGLLETSAAADGIVRAAHDAGLREASSPRDVFRAAVNGDERAAMVVAAEARLVASAICCVITVVDPGLVILGGGIGQAPGFAEAVTEALASIAPVLPEVRVSALGTEVVVDGCLAEATSLAWTDLVAALP